MLEVGTAVYETPKSFPIAEAPKRRKTPWNSRPLAARLTHANCDYQQFGWTKRPTVRSAREPDATFSKWRFDRLRKPMRQQMQTVRAGRRRLQHAPTPPPIPLPQDLRAHFDKRVSNDKCTR
jgi:hypothetical protein